MLIDTHCHFHDASFEADREVVVDRARRSDVRVMLVVGTSIESSRKAIELAEGLDGIYATVGVHPSELLTASGDWPERVRELAGHEKVLGIGETGIDLYRKYAPEDLQREAFRTHLAISRELSLPVVIHSRAAGKEVIEDLAAFSLGKPVRGVMHCFTEKEDVMRQAVALGLHISFAGPLTYPISRKSREVVKNVPDDRLLVETDSPYLGAQPVKHRRNEPSYLRFVASKVAEMRRLSPRDIARITTLNADNLFRLGVADREPKIAYTIRSVLYLNITNRCNNACTFCPRNWDDAPGAYYVKGHNLRLHREPSVDEVMAAIGDVSPYREIVFCGFGEPTLRLDVLLEVGRRIRAEGQHVRLNTNGLGSMHHGRDIVPELDEVLDSISISLNAADSAAYVEECRPEGGPEAYAALIEFIKSARAHIPVVQVTAVEQPGGDGKAVKRLARELDVKYHGRPMDSVG